MNDARRLAIVALALLLSGCWWEGPPFYKGDPRDGGPVAPGWYKFDLLGDHRSPVTEHVEWLPDGQTRSTPRKITRKNGVIQFVTARLNMPGRNLWVAQMPANDDSKKDAIYGLIERRGDLLSFTFPLDCDSNVAIVKAAGGTVSNGQMRTSEPDTQAVGGDMSATGTKRPATGMSIQAPPDARTGTLENQICSFPDRPSLERALNAYAIAHPQLEHMARLKRLGN